MLFPSEKIRGRIGVLGATAHEIIMKKKRPGTRCTQTASKRALLSSQEEESIRRSSTRKK